MFTKQLIISPLQTNTDIGAHGADQDETVSSESILFDILFMIFDQYPYLQQ